MDKQDLSVITPVKPFNLTVIVLSFNTKDITDECLTRLKKAKKYSEEELKNEVEVIVVENASEDGSLEMIKKNHPWVRLIVSKTNTGFSGGNNIGMKEAKYENFLLLNSDAYVEEDTLLKALNYLQENPECDLLGPQLHFADGRLQPSAGYLPTPPNTILWISGLALLPGMEMLTKPIHPKNLSFYKSTKQVEWVMGAFMMLRRQVYEKTMGFDESIFMYGEEVEWCKRIKDKGFKTYYVPTFKITHLDKASSKFMLEKPLLNEIKGIVRYFHQHYPYSYPFVQTIMYISLLLRAIVFTLLGNSQRRKAYIEALKVL